MTSPLETIHAPAGETFPAILQRHAAEQPDRTAFVFLKNGETIEKELTFAGLHRKAQTIAAAMAASGGRPGDRILLIYPQGLEFITAFFGCLAAGMIAVPVYPPNPKRLKQDIPRFLSIVHNAEPSFVLTTADLAEKYSFLGDAAPELKKLRWMATDVLEDHKSAIRSSVVIQPQMTAFLQYTSGSTGAPKGVMVSHDNLVQNNRMIADVTEANRDGVFVTWLPLYHDMGLIGTVLQPVFTGLTCYLMAPIAFLQKPVRWLRAVSRFGATYSGGPNFAYELCIRRISEDRKKDLDLSRWKVAFNGAEPVRIKTMERFADAFAECGYHKTAAFPCYGLAEATLLVSNTPRQNVPVSLSVNVEALEKRGVVQEESSGNSRRLVSSGRIAGDLKVRIVNPDTGAVCKPDEIGEIWVSGSTVADGYWQNPEETQKVFRATLSGETYLRTGDLGVLRDGELFVTGRLKDLIIIRGRNHYPQDIEMTVENSYPAIRPGCCAAFPVEMNGEERLVVVAEVERRRAKHTGPAPLPEWIRELRRNEPLPKHLTGIQNAPDMQAAADAVRKEIADSHQLQAYTVAFIKAGSIPKTSSGKIRRRECRRQFLEGELTLAGGRFADDHAFCVNGPEAIQSEWKTATRNRQIRLLATYLAELASGIMKIDPKQAASASSLIELGLDSLMAIEMQQRTETDLGITLSITELFGDYDIPTLSRMAMERCTPPEPHPEDAGHGAPEAAPLSHNQQSLWFLHRLAPESAAYNVSFSVIITSPLNEDAFRSAFFQLVARHPVLNTVFTESDAGPVQQVKPEAWQGWETVDASGWTDEELHRELSRLAARPFDLENGPVVRAVLCRLSAGRHALLFCVHHIAVDLWSVSILIDELRILYSAAAKGEDAGLPSLPTDYKKYVHRQQNMLAGEKGRQLFAYWQEKIGSNLPVLDLPTDFPRPRVHSFNGNALPFQISGELARQIKDLAVKHRATPYMMLLAAFQVLLSRYTGQTDIPVGTPAAGREWPGFRDVVGYFANPIVIRSDLSDDPAFSGFLSRVREAVLEGLAHQSFPFSLLVERLQPDRDPSRSPMFQAMFVLEKTQRLPDAAPFATGKIGASMSLGELKLSSLPLAHPSSQFDLSMILVESKDGYSGSLEYSTDLFREDTIRRLIGHFDALVHHCISAPDTPLSRLGIITRAEKEELVSGGALPVREIPRNRSIIEIIQRQAEDSPESPAVIAGETVLSFRELNEAANHLAGFLMHDLSIAPGGCIGVMLERSQWPVIAMLGVLKAGCVYVPIDPAFPDERIQYILEDSGCRAVLCEEIHLLRLEALFDPRKIWDIEAAHHPDAAPPDHIPEPGDGSYMIYTSGSTGRPKGVVQTHRCLNNLIEWQMEETGGAWRILQYAAPGFDVSMQETLYALASGSTLHVIPAEMRYDIPALAAALEAWKIEMITMPFSALNLLFQEPAFAEKNTALRHIITSGEALHVTPEIRRFLETRPHVKLHNQYGPTETHVVTAFTLSAELENITEYPPIGSPLPNTRMMILDPNGELMPRGLPGEICVGGDPLAKGYLNRPELTAEKFIPNPYLPGERLYRTGDLGRLMPDGAILYLGRNDDQVKVRGHRVELGEIETHLRQHPGVKEAVVLAKTVNGGTELIAYTVEKPEADGAVPLKDFLKKRMPGYMIPAFFVEVEGFEYTPNGKVDKRALPGPDPGSRQAGPDFTAPRDPVESALAEIWQEVLGLPQVGIHDSFFDCGGHSLKATQLVNRIRSRMDITVPVRDIFQYPVLSDLAEHIRKMESAEPDRIAESETPLSDEEKEALMKLLEGEE